MKKVKSVAPNPNSSPQSQNRHQVIPESQPSRQQQQPRVLSNRNRNLILNERRNRDKFSGAKIKPVPRSGSREPSSSLPALSPLSEEAAQVRTAVPVPRQNQAGAGLLNEPVFRSKQQQPAATAGQQPRKFNFEQTLKDFGFNPKLLSSSPFNNNKPKENVVTRKQQLQPVQSFTSAQPGQKLVFTPSAAPKNKIADVSSTFSQEPGTRQTSQSQPHSTLSPSRASAISNSGRGQPRGRDSGNRNTGLSSLLAIAGDPEVRY